MKFYEIHGTYIKKMDRNFCGKLFWKLKRWMLLRWLRKEVTGMTIAR